jgi:molybdopterin/thiamine biosynthesis adenylyltransferase
MTQERYSRQILFKDIGEHGQQTISLNKICLE